MTNLTDGINVKIILETRRRMELQQDGAAPHFTLTVQQFCIKIKLGGLDEDVW